MHNRSLLIVALSYGFGLSNAWSFQLPDPQDPQIAANSSPAISPLDLKQKYLYSLDRVIGPSRLIGFVAHAAFDQIWKKPEQWGSEPESFPVRMASHFGDHLLKETIGFGVRVADGEDPRYFRSGHGSALKRTEYALTRTFWVHRDGGTMMPAYSLLVANYATPAIVHEWRPGPFDGMLEFRAGTIGLGIATVTNVWHEFSPDLRKKLPMRFQRRLNRVVPGG